jgi:two-component system cell cycle sensor histidine kinase/response regulator CckA
MHTMAASILLVQPDPQTRVLAAFMLERLGYQVTQTRSGEEAMAADGPFDLLLTEAVMSRLNGHDLAEKLRAAQPNLRALFVADADYERIARKAASKRGVRFLRRPFTMTTLAEAVSDALGERAMFARIS